MPERSRLVDAVVEALADGEEIDWSALERRADPGESRRVEALRLVERASRYSGSRAELTGSRIATPVTRLQGLAAGDVAILVVACVQSLAALATPVAWAGGPLPLPPILVRLAVAAFLGPGLMLILAGRADRRSVHLGSVSLCAASALSLTLLPKMAPLVPVAVTARVLRFLLVDAFLPMYLWRFVREFPRVGRFQTQSRVAAVAIGLSATIGLALFAANALTPFVGSSGPLHGLLRLLNRSTGGFYWLLVAALALPAPFFAWSRATRAAATERQRLHWFTGAVAVGVSPLLLAVLAEVVFPEFARWVDQPQVRLWTGVALFGALLTIPLTTSYAVLAHRVLDVWLVFQRALAFALARWSALSLAALPSAAFAILLYRRRDLPIAQVLSRPLPTCLGLAAIVGWLLYAARPTLLRRLEARLVGIRQEAAVSLAVLTAQLRRVTAVDQLPRILADAMRALVGADWTLLLLSSSDGAVYVGTNGSLRLPSASGLPAIVAAASRPLRLDPADPRSAFSWLVAEDRSWIQGCGAAVLAQVGEGESGIRGLLVLGPTIGGSPFRERDLEAINTVASTTALALEALRSPIVKPPPPPPLAGQCLACGAVAPEADGACVCGGDLTPAAVPYELAGKFRLQGVLGRGGMGVVYRAMDLTLGRAVALKTLPRLSDSALARLQREARSMAAFVHPNLALIFGTEAWQGVPVLVVEYLPGGSLAAALPGRFTTAEVLRLGGLLADALATLHGAGVLHRDIKPANIAFAGDGTPKLLDFGLAHLAGAMEGDEAGGAGAPSWLVSAASPESLTRSGAVVGTPLYLSPEVVAGQPSSPAQDLWSLHLVLWEALTGRHPLAGLAERTALRRLAAGDLPFAQLDDHGIPAVLRALLRAGLHRDPTKRPQTAAEMRATLVEAAARPG